MSSTYKNLVSVRINATNLEKLKSCAEEMRRSVSILVDWAVDEWLKRKSAEESLEPSSAEVISGDFLLDAEDLKRMMPVVEAMGKSLPLKLFIDLIGTLRP